MHNFVDQNKTTWNIKVHALSLARVEDALGVSFSKPDDNDGPFLRITYDPIFTFRALYVLCKEQVDERGLTDDQFSELLVGDAFERAQAALLEAIADFFPDPARREAAKLLIKTMKEAGNLLVQKASKKINELDIDKLTDEVIQHGSE